MLRLKILRELSGCKLEIGSRLAYRPLGFWAAAVVDFCGFGSPLVV